MASKDDKIYRVSGNSSETLDEIRKKLIASGALRDGVSDKEFLDYIITHLSESGLENHSNNIPDEREKDNSDPLVASNDLLQTLESILDQVKEIAESVGIMRLKLQKNSDINLSIDNSNNNSFDDQFFSDEKTSDKSEWYSILESPPVVFSYDLWIPEFTQDEIAYLKTVESDSYNKGYFLTRDEKGRLKLPSGHFYNDNDFPCDQNGVGYWRTPFGFYPQIQCETYWHLTHPSFFPHRFFKERSKKLQKWYGRNPSDGWISTVDPDYSYDTDPVNFLITDPVAFIKDHNLDFWSCAKEGGKYEQIG